MGRNRIKQQFLFVYNLTFSGIRTEKTETETELKAYKINCWQMTHVF